MNSVVERFLLRKAICVAAIVGLILGTVAGLPHSVTAASRNGLWVIVSNICLPAYQSIGVSFPCAEVNIPKGPEHGFAVVQIPSIATHIVVVPTARISGIESPDLLRDTTPNYWEAAWNARRYVEDGAHRRLPRERIGMAINSAFSRSQDQLHIHVACISPEVAEFLHRQRGEIRGTWSSLHAKLLGHRFVAMKIEADDLAQADPFKLLARGLPSGNFSMASQTLTVVGAKFDNGKTGFYLLANDSGATPADIVSAEALLDERCTD
jgi:CDP-diacylglycerol pyrophosphatase